MTKHHHDLSYLTPTKKHKSNYTLSSREGSMEHMFDVLSEIVSQKTDTPHSHTTTQTLTEKKMDQDAGIHSGVTSRLFNAWSGLKRPKSALPTPGIKLDTVDGFQCVGGPGQQANYVLWDVGTYAQAYGTAIEATQQLETSPVNYMSLVPTQLQQNTTYYGTIGNSVEDKIIMSSCSVNVQITNASNASAIIDLYLIRAKRDVPKTPDTVAKQFVATEANNIWFNGLLSESAGRPNEIYLTGTTAPVAGAEQTSQLLAKPTESRIYRSQYDIVKVHHINLAAGATEDVSYNLKMNLTYDYMKDQEKLQLGIRNNDPVANASQSANIVAAYRLGLKAHGFSLHMIQRGQPVYDAGGGGVTTSSTAVNIIVSKKHKFALWKENSRKFTTVQANNVVNTSTTLANQKLINIVDADVPVLQGQ